MRNDIQHGCLVINQKHVSQNERHQDMILKPFNCIPSRHLDISLQKLDIYVHLKEKYIGFESCLLSFFFVFSSLDLKGHVRYFPHFTYVMVCKLGQLKPNFIAGMCIGWSSLKLMFLFNLKNTAETRGPKCDKKGVSGFLL